jgi:hypothetical protein
MSRWARFLDRILALPYVAVVGRRGIMLRPWRVRLPSRLR